LLVLREDQGLQSGEIKCVEIRKSYALGHCAQYARNFSAHKKNAHNKKKISKKTLRSRKLLPLTPPSEAPCVRVASN
jgi:hypothetical protein